MTTENLSCEPSFVKTIMNRFPEHKDIWSCFQRPKDKHKECCKIVTAGDPGVGKSCIIRRFCEKRFTERYIATIGIDYGLRKIKNDGRDVEVHFWDMAGHEEYAEVRNECYDQVDAAILVFDINKKSTFENLNKWVSEIRLFSKNASIFVVGNKFDLLSETIKACVEKPQVESLTQKSNIEGYFECSAFDGSNVDDLFDKIILKFCTSRMDLQSTV